MKQVHNCRLRLQTQEKEEARELLLGIIKAAGIKEEEASITMHKDAEGYASELWLDNQQPVRKLLKLIQAELPTEQKELIAKHPEKYIDTQTHCFLHFSLEALKKGEWTLNRNPDAAILRLNIAAFPATKENSEKIVKELFTSA